ncbi:MAG: hypothetical protein DRZ82_09120 [Thermoprotei archaeon]|nr:MAG: hypothetical protein DRZ82_09120 [Thermoprotei archaeon]
MDKTKVGRFQVMAILQAARYYLLTGDIEKAKSFGLNRAIFYAWAKKYGKYRPPPERKIEPGKEVIKVKEDDKEIVYVGNEGAYISERGWFIIGEKEQLPQDYDRQIISRINSIMPYEEVWRKVIEYLKKFPKSYLLDQQKFYEKIYKPIRDQFLDFLKGKQKQESLESFL